MNKTDTLRRGVVVLIVVAGLTVPAVAASAATTPTLNQTINAGTLSTDILENDGATPVASPAVGFPAVNVSLSCQTSTATLPSSTNRLYVTNLATNNGWTLAIAATGGDTATWTTGSNTYKYNDAAGSGCTNGQLTVNPAVATLTDDCSGNCSDTGVTKGSSAAYVSGTTSSVTLMTDSNGTAWEGYLTGIGLSQKIPHSQLAGSYSLPMTITVTAN